ncbi:imidazolonepropionase [Rubripirellula obstinata]|uniref:Imidazolonepropionase n=1 Tax=Rubripirellula obstinata TaxID=406547 RepID=A0A5B1CME5_9BACT|nr:amidohydrolase family protein [Rubripirellula obstinata]KAA1261716.1 imidazolonepropionase [Rubripirellula obstinata]
MNRLICFLVLLLVISGKTIAHDQIPGSSQSGPILIQNATIYPVDDAVIANGSILFDNGRIVALGQDIAVPEDTRVIEGTGKHVYPGLIESMTDLGLREVAAVEVTVDRTETGDLNPNVRSWVAVNPDSELIPVARAGGVLLAHVSPGGPWIRGQTSVMQLDGWTAKEMNLKAPAGMSVNWNWMMPSDKDAKKQASKRNEKLAELDELFDRVRRYGDAKAASPKQVTSDVRLEAMLPVIRGQQPMFVAANRRAAIESAVAYSVKNDLRLVIYGGYDAAECADLLREYKIPVIVSATYRLPMYRHDAYDAAYTLPNRLKEAGVQFSIAGEGPGYPGGSSNTRNLPYHAACAVAYGLPREDAIRAVTLSAAEILGIDDRVGSISIGKDASLIVCDGDILETETNVELAFLQGREVDLTSRHTMLFKKYQQKYRQKPKGD